MPADAFTPEHPYQTIQAPSPYRELAAHLPNRVGIGGALITMVEPDPGHEADYNRWYEDDHFYAGATVGPWMFAGRRWVAPLELRRLRFPDDSPIASPVTKGCYISTYLALEGHFDDVVAWGIVMMRDHLRPYGRGFDHREHVFTSFSGYEFGVVRDDMPYLLPHHVLDHPFQGLVVEVLERTDDVTGAEMKDRLRERLIPEDLSGSPAAAVLAFTPSSLPRGAAVTERNLTLLWFLQTDPRAAWPQFQAHTALAERAGARLVFAGGFIPTIPGTDAYVDELRSAERNP